MTPTKLWGKASDGLATYYNEVGEKIDVEIFCAYVGIL